MNQIWTDTEKEFIRQNAGILTDQQGADQLSRISGRDITSLLMRGESNVRS
jgi:hypothetical protein